MATPFLKFTLPLELLIPTPVRRPICSSMVNSVSVTIDEYFRGVRPFNTGRSITTYANLAQEEKKKFLSYDVAISKYGDD